MSTVAVTDRGQIVIPASLRRKFHIKKGSKLSVEESEGGIIVLRPYPDARLEDPIEKSKAF